jgi:5-methylcytosine-specific restriction endonuclease McrA
MLDGKVLILNQNYEPLTVCTVKRALLMLFGGKAHSVELRPEQVRSVSAAWAVPSVVRLARYVQAPVRRVVLSKRNILKRDNYECQYCGARGERLTLDHVVPRKSGGPSTWENLVCACVACNNRKGESRPEQAGLQLRRRPRRPNNISYIRSFVGVTDHRWRPYLFFDQEPPEPPPPHPALPIDEVAR